MNQSRQAQREYVQAVLDLYVALPATRHAPGRQDRRLAAALYERGIPLGLVPLSAALLARCCSQDLAWRRRLRPNTLAGSPTTSGWRCLHYFLNPVIDGAQELPARPQIRRLPLLQARALHETQTRSEVDSLGQKTYVNFATGFVLWTRSSCVAIVQKLSRRSTASVHGSRPESDGDGFRRRRHEGPEGSRGAMAGAFMLERS